MDYKVIQKKIAIYPNCLNKDIDQHIYDKLRLLFDNSCSKEHGYILNIDRDIKVLENEVGIGGTTMFMVEIKVKTLKPFVDQVVEGSVCGVYEEGILIDVEGKMNVLIRSDRLENYTYCKYDESFVHGKKKIEKGDKLWVKIKQIKYDKNSYKCIGDLKIEDT